MTSQGTQLQEVELQLDMAKQSLAESKKSLKASQKSAEYGSLLWHLAVSVEGLHQQSQCKDLCRIMLVPA